MPIDRLHLGPNPFQRCSCPFSGSAPTSKLFICAQVTNKKRIRGLSLSMASIGKRAPRLYENSTLLLVLPQLVTVSPRFCHAVVSPGVQSLG